MRNDWHIVATGDGESALAAAGVSETEYMAFLAAICPEYKAELLRQWEVEEETRAERELLVFLAKISTKHEDQLRRVLEEEAKVAADRELLEFLANFCAEYECEL